ncbi:MAG: sigma-70 family RNA polymerase sigma factor [Phycisphaerae bacterium]|nr:sigma-70 family RNA polymerase sigma factor [Phycisphaerae bacterium]
MQPTDRKLIERYVQGDRTAFNDLIRTYGPSVLGFLRRVCHNLDDADDCFQETFRRVHEKAHTIQGDTFKPWLFRVATNVAMDRFRRQKRERAVALDCELASPEALSPLETAVDASASPENEVIQDEQVRQVRQAVASLPERQRTTLVLAYYQKLSYTQVAEVLGCSVGTVKQQMFRALKALAVKLPNPSNA